jgi:hypothetical protein
MIEVQAVDLRQAVEQLFACRVELRTVKTVKEEFQGQTVWKALYPSSK